MFKVLGSIAVLASLATLSACGDVNSGVCAGAQDDMVACTVDICNEESAAWAHIPDNSLCDPGQRCDPTGGCVAAGALTGKATLFAHTDHSGITVSIDGVEGATTTTAADGSWSLGAVPTGTYTVTYTKDKYITQAEAGIAVFPEAANSPTPVELRHGGDLGDDKRMDYPIGSQYNATFYTPDRNHVVVRYSNFVYSGGGMTYQAYSLTAPKAPVTLFGDPQYYGSIPFYLTNTHAIWNLNNQTVWSRPLDGGPAVILGTANPNETIVVQGTPGPYVVLQKQRYTGSYYENTLYVVKADGSVPMGAPVWTSPDAQHNLDFVVNNDTTALIGLNNAVGTDAAANIPLRRIDLATGAVSNVTSGFNTNSTAVFSVSPDRSYVFGYLYQGSTNWYRSFLIPISGTAGPSLGPDYGAGAGVKYSDYPGGGHTWFTDSSGVVLASSGYNGLEGGLKVWATNQPQSTVLAAVNSYNSWSVHNKVVTFRDSTNGALKVVSAHSTSPVTYTLDSSGTILQDFAYNDAASTASYLVWTQSISNSNGTRAKIFAVNMASPLLAAPTVTQLGGTLATTCAYEAVLSDTTYWQLCQDTGVLSGFTQSSTTAGTQTQGVRGGLVALPDADRVAFRKYDSKLYSSPNTGTLSEVKLISTLWDTTASLYAFSSWVLFRDSDWAYTRASKADGSSIDEPITACKQAGQYVGPGPAMLFDTMKTNVLFTQMQCSSGLFGETFVPAANLP